jgi:hypothetical protein
LFFLPSQDKYNWLLGKLRVEELAEVPRCSGLHGDSYYPDGHTASATLADMAGGEEEMVVADEERETRGYLLLFRKYIFVRK